ACANASQYGNNAYIAPDASMKDGLLDVIVLQPFSMLEAPIVAMQLFQRTLPNNSHVKIYRTKRLCIERTSAGPAHCDGDPYDTTARINVELVPAGLRAIINEKALVTPPTSSVQSNMLLRALEPFQKQMVNLRNHVNSLFDTF
ncbi:MAG: diacylglycerol kinase family lipid kinase, partial [Alloprevotella sp.]